MADKDLENKKSENTEMSVEKKRQLILFFVLALAAIIFAVWAYNLKNVWRYNPGDDFKLDIIKEEIGDSLNKIEDSLDEKTRLQDDAGQMLNDLLEEAEKSAVPEIDEDVNFGEDKMATSSEEALKPGRLDCPDWINCMPGPDVSRPCVVPVGCEDITQIAY